MPKPQPYVPHSLGTRIAHARRLLGVREGRDVTVPDLAMQVQVTSASVYNWEADISTPGEGNLAQLAKVLGVTPAYLRYGVGKAAVPLPEPDANGLEKAGGE